MTLNITRTRRRLTGGLIGYNMVACGSSATSAAAAAVGTVTITHGMDAAPTAAWGAPLAANTLDACGRYVGLKGMGVDYITFITASAPPIASVDATAISSALSSSVVMTFVWAAIK